MLVLILAISLAFDVICVCRLPEAVSTYCLFAASVPLVGKAKFRMFCLFMSMLPVTDNILADPVLIVTLSLPSPIVAPSVNSIEEFATNGLCKVIV